MNGEIYVIQFEQPIGSEKHAVQFYGGWTRQFDARMDCHSKGRGARLTRYAALNGIGWTVVYRAPGTPQDEKAMKGWKNYRQFLASKGITTD